MERNERVVKTLLEENLNQYFSEQRSLSRGNVETSRLLARDSKTFRHNQDNNYGRSVSLSEYNKRYGNISRKNCEQQPLYYRRNDTQLVSSTESGGKSNNDTPYESRNVGAVGDCYGYKSNNDRSAKSGHYESKSSSKTYGYSRNDNNLRNSGSHSNDPNSRNRDSCIGYCVKSQDRNSDALAADRLSKCNDNSNNGDQYDINCDPRNDDEPPTIYVGNNIDRFSRSNISNDRAANTNVVGNVGSNNEDCFDRNNHVARNDFSNELMNNGCFRTDLRLGNKRCNASRNNEQPAINYYCSNNFVGINKRPYTNVSEMTTPIFAKVDRKRPYEFHERGVYNKSRRNAHTGSSFNTVSATLPSTSVNVTTPDGKKKKKKDIRHSARRINASIRDKIEKKINAANEVQKVKSGNSKADPEKYWKAWWPKFAYIEKSIQMFDDVDMKSLEPSLKFTCKPSDPNFIIKKKTLLRQGVNKLNRNSNITESNYKARDVVKLFTYRKQLSDPNFQKHLNEFELTNVRNALNTAKARVRLALFLQNMIYKWHDFTEIIERQKNGEHIPGRHAQNSMNDKLFNYLVSDCIKELKQMCSKEWPGFDEFYNSLTTTSSHKSKPLPANRPADTTFSSKAVALPTTSAPVRKHVCPSKKRYSDRRLSRKILENLDKADPATLNYKQSQSLIWARSIEKQDTPPTFTKQSEIKLCSADEPQVSKRTKVIGGNAGLRSFAEVAKDSLEMAVINRGDEEGSIPNDKWSVVENGLSCVYSEVLRELPGPPPVCDDAGWYQGRIKLMRFGNERSVECYRCALKKIGEIWPGADLDVVKKEDIPSRPRAHAWIPATPSDAVSIVKRLQDCNPSLPTHNWKVGRLDAADGTRMHAFFVLNAESLPLLEKSEGRVSYGFDRIQLIMHKADSGDNSEDTPPDNPGEVSAEGPFPSQVSGIQLENTSIITGSDESLDELLVDTHDEVNSMVGAQPRVYADKPPPL